MRKKRSSTLDFFGDFLRMLSEFAEMREDMVLISMVNGAMKVIQEDSSYVRFGF